MDTRPCPSSFLEGCPVGECARLESDDETPWLAEPGRTPGQIEQAIEADLLALADNVKAGKLGLAALARKLARVIDARGDDEPPSQLAKAADTLRITMNQIASGEEANTDVRQQLEYLLSRPSAGGSAMSAEVRYPKES